MSIVISEYPSRNFAQDQRCESWCVAELLFAPLVTAPGNPSAIYNLVRD